MSKDGIVSGKIIAIKRHIYHGANLAMLKAGVARGVGHETHELSNQDSEPPWAILDLETYNVKKKKKKPSWSFQVSATKFWTLVTV